MLTLCRLDAPVSLRPPQAPQLKPFKFFMSRERQPDGSERLYLHMGFFATLGDAERWAETVRRHYPSAFASIAPLEFLQSHSQTPSLSSTAAQPVATGSNFTPSARDSLTDSQVLRILGARAARDDVDRVNSEQVALLGPDDTATRQALKEAVVQGERVSFAVQLQWSAQPIDLTSVRSNPIFKAYSLYATERRRKGHVVYFLRLGFFADPLSAKEVAAQVLRIFPSAAVVPVIESEVTRARTAGVGTVPIPYLVEQGDDQKVVDPNATAAAPTQPRTLRDGPSRLSRGAKTVKQPLEPLTEEELSTEPDPLSESGVRHLRVRVQEPVSGRWKIIRLNSTPADMM